MGFECALRILKSLSPYIGDVATFTSLGRVLESALMLAADCHCMQPVEVNPW